MTHQMTFQDVMQFYTTQSLVPQMGPTNDEYIKAMINTGMGTDVWNAIYGSQAWYQLNAEANLFAVLPKLSWDRSGVRMISDFSEPLADLGISETGNISTPTTPTINTLKYTPKILQTPFEVTDVVEQLAKVTQDDMYANLDTLRNYASTMHIKLLNQGMGQIAVGSSAATSASGASILQMESYDRIVASYDEATGVGLSGTSSPTLAQVINPYAGALDRSAGASNLDSYVKSASGTFGTLGSLTDAQIRDTIQGIRTNGGRTQFIVTGYDTYATIQGIYSNQMRYMNLKELNIRTGINGVETADGIDSGNVQASLYHLPLIQAVNTPSDSFQTNGASRMYFMDTSDTEGYGDSRWGVQILRPTQYLETTDRDFILLNNIAYEGLYLTIAENTCRFFGAQGKIRDIEVT